MTYTKTKLAVNRNVIKLKDFIFNLAMALIRSTDKQMYYIDRTVYAGMTDIGNIVTLLQLLFQHNESTLMEWLSKVKWPIRFKLKHFTETEI
jgi:hypothetical protein